MRPVQEYQNVHIHLDFIGNRLIEGVDSPFVEDEAMNSLSIKAIAILNIKKKFLVSLFYKLRSLTGSFDYDTWYRHIQSCWLHITMLLGNY